MDLNLKNQTAVIVDPKQIQLAIAIHILKDYLIESIISTGEYRGSEGPVAAKSSPSLCRCHE